jgi:hypothetical protein
VDSHGKGRMPWEVHMGKRKRRKFTDEFKAEA